LRYVTLLGLEAGKMERVTRNGKCFTNSLLFEWNLENYGIIEMISVRNFEIFEMYPKIGKYVTNIIHALASG